MGREKQLRCYSDATVFVAGCQPEPELPGARPNKSAFIYSTPHITSLDCRFRLSVSSNLCIAVAGGSGVQAIVNALVCSPATQRS